MNNKIRFATILLITMAISLSGCLPSSKDQDSLCKDRKVEFCEDFESTSHQMQFISFAGEEWFVDGDDRLSNWSGDLPVDGRSRQYMASVGLLLGKYENHSKALLLTPAIDLTDVSSAKLSFNVMFMTEDNWDGMLVIATIDGGETWLILDPSAGYPGTLRAGKYIIPGYAGFQPFWSHEEVDLSSLLGLEAKLGFYFLSDGEETYQGIALDDISIDTDSRILVSQVSHNVPFSEVNLILPQDPIVSTDIPSAIASQDTLCEGGQSETLKESHRAYVKAINQDGDRYLVLHPESGNFCWVQLEDIWIDTSDVELPQISDISPEDLYLPFCSLIKTPVFFAQDCISDSPSGQQPQGLITYQLDRALVANGKITTMIISPDANPGDDIPGEQTDPRVGDKTLLDPFTPGFSLGGNLSLSVNGNPESCYFDSVDPGRIICEGTSIDAAGPLEIKTCWQGWDGSQICPIGLSAYSNSGRCHLLENIEGCEPTCPEGYSYLQDSKICIVNREPTYLERPDDRCPDNFRVNPGSNCCVTQDLQEQFTCPPGFYYLAEKAACQKAAGEGVCPEGLVVQENTGSCLPETGTTPQKCSIVEIHFPKIEVTVKEPTICTKGPGSIFESIGSLSSFAVVEVLGMGGSDDYLVINHPKYQVPCWAKLDDFYWDKLNLPILPRIPSP